MAEFERDLETTLRDLLPLYEHIDLKIESASNGVFRCFVPLNERNSNHFKTMHAALQWAAAEALGGVVLAASGIDLKKFLGGVRSVESDFLKPAETSVTAESHFSDAQMRAMKMDLEENGRCDFELDAVVRNRDGETVAQTKGVYAVRPRRKPSPS